MTRIKAPIKDIAKFKEAFLYILQKTAHLPHIGRDEIFSMLYFIDFDYYEKYEEQFMGLTYIKIPNP